MNEKEVGGMARCCAYSPDGNSLAVGYGGSVGKKKGKNKEDGMVRVYRQGEDATRNITLTKLVEIKEAKQWVSVLRFSPDGMTLAVGSRDNSIYLYSVPQQYKRKVC